VAPDLDEPLLLYITAIAKVVSMVLVAEQPEPHQHQEPKGTYAAGSGSLDSGPAEGTGVVEPDGSQIPEASLALVTQVRSHVAIGSQLPGAHAGSGNQEATRSLDPEALSDLRGQEPPETEPMEVDAPDPLGRVWTIQCSIYYISEVPHDPR
jgi:hypothetical protein